MILHKKLFFYIITGFIIATVIGTVSHEMGHYLVAKGLGYTASMNYMSTNWDSKERPFLDSCFDTYSQEIENNQPFPQKEKFDAIETQMSKDIFWFIMGGPLKQCLLVLQAC